MLDRKLKDEIGKHDRIIQTMALMFFHLRVPFKRDSVRARRQGHGT